MPAIDHTHLTRQTSGDARLAAEVLRLFRDQVAPLAADPDEGAWQKLPLARMLHTVRGAALGIGATALARAASIAPPPDGTASKLAIAWTAPATDSAHGAAASFNLRFSPSGAGSWTVVSAVSNPYTLTGLNGATTMDIEVQAVNAAGIAGAWSAVTTGTTWGTLIAPGALVPAATQVHGTGVVAVNGSSGVNLVATPAPTAVAGAAFAWSASQTAVPTSGLLSVGGTNVVNGWGGFPLAPATTGPSYLWMLTQGANGATSGALVSSVINVT